MNNDKKTDDIFASLQLMNKNAIIEFLLKMNSVDLIEYTDKLDLLSLIDITMNYISICKKLDLEEKYILKLKSVKEKILKHINNQTTLTL